MSLDDQNPITPLESETIRYCLKTVAASVVALVALYTGKAVDLAFVNKVIDLVLPLIVISPTFYLQYKAIKARINATKVIKKE